MSSLKSNGNQSSSQNKRQRKPFAFTDANLSILKSIFMGARNGAMFGAGIRFPVALLTALFFKKLRGIPLAKYVIQQVLKHSIGLALYSASYKGLRRLLRNARQVPYYNWINTFIAGGTVGAILLGTPTSGNTEIVLYCIKFVIEGLIYFVGREKGYVTFPSWLYPIMTFLVLGTLFSLSENYPGAMKASFIRTMRFLYYDTPKKAEIASVATT